MDLNFSILITTAVVIASGCASPQVVKVNATMLVPPDRMETSRYRRVAVLPFEGPQGTNIAAQAASALSGMKWNGRPILTVVDYRDLKDKHPELYEMAKDPPLAKEMLQEVGRALGVKGIYTGSVLSAVTGETYERGRSTFCERYEGDRCAQEKKTVTRCSGAQSSISTGVRLIDVANGWTVYSGTASGRSRSEDCWDQDVTAATGRASTKKAFVGDVLETAVDGLTGYKTAAKQAVWDEARANAFTQLLNAVGPHVVSVEIELKEPGPENVSEDVRTRIRQGLAAAKKMDMRSACRLWTDALTLQQTSATILYNLGVCEELQGHLPEANDLYQRSAAQPGGQDAYVRIALRRIKDHIANLETLDRMGY